MSVVVYYGKVGRSEVGHSSFLFLSGSVGGGECVMILCGTWFMIGPNMGLCISIYTTFICNFCALRFCLKAFPRL
jgi:hypothetical protein